MKPCWIKCAPPYPKTTRDTLAQSIAQKSAAEDIKRLIGEYVTSHQLRVGDLSAQQLADRLYGDMAGFGFLDKYIADPEIEEINGNSWRDIEIVTRSGWHKVPGTLSFATARRGYSA